MKNLKRIGSMKIAGGRRGGITASIKELTTVFGTYTDVSKDSDGKVTTEWNFQDGNNYYTIYDYKQTARYSASLPSLEDFRIDQNKAIEWSVGANCNANEFIELVNGKLEALRSEPQGKMQTATTDIRYAFYEIGDRISKLKSQEEYKADERYKVLVANMEKDHDKLRKYLDDNYRWD